MFEERAGTIVLTFPFCLNFLLFSYRNMAKDHEKILKCLRGKSHAELTQFQFETPSFLTAMGPSRDGVLIPSDFGTPGPFTHVRKRAQGNRYQVIIYVIALGQSLQTT